MIYALSSHATYLSPCLSHLFLLFVCVSFRQSFSDPHHILLHANNETFPNLFDIAKPTYEISVTKRKSYAREDLGCKTHHV